MQCVLRPLFLQVRDGQPLEQLFPAREVGFQRRHAQALAEPARAGEEVGLAPLYELVDEGRLVNVDVAFRAENKKVA